ncbi:hypothetical protein LTR37_007041 [Vermiconidia calcicola]|uniref:Uncharacterized protein n=1 Tax=Vermiconidia calcicola TaxID=1690605 RepID=A0ACC3NEV8_9PEZI|nr:hypothetical protein LTR37_007041 [Vermiconidia calcicola]
MAAPKAEKKRKRNRKARTEGIEQLYSGCNDQADPPVSSSSSSSGDETASAPEQDHVQKRTSVSSASSVSDDTNGVRNGVSAPPQSQRVMNPNQAFEDFYLKQATKEFANDLDKLRSAADFNERSVPILIAALKQGTTCFKEEERIKIGEAALAKHESADER